MIDSPSADKKTYYGRLRAVPGIVIFLASLGALSAMVLAIGVVLLALLPDVPLKALPGLTSASVKTTPDPVSPEELYLDLMKKALTRALVAPPFERRTLPPKSRLVQFFQPIQDLMGSKGLELVRVSASAPESYTEGGYSATNRMEDAETMIGTRQLDNLQYCIREVLARKVPGDLIEAGAWRGGVTILMRAALKAHGDTERKVFVADSFEGLPPADEALNFMHHRKWVAGEMLASLEEVKNNFARYGLLDSQVVFLKGYFNRTLPTAPIERLSILRADADLYESTRDVLETLYPKLSVGGYAIFDDYRVLPDCQRAIDDYRRKHQITEPIQIIDKQAVYWKRER